MATLIACFFAACSYATLTTVPRDANSLEGIPCQYFMMTAVICCKEDANYDIVTYGPKPLGTRFGEVKSVRLFSEDLNSGCLLKISVQPSQGDSKKTKFLVTYVPVYSSHSRHNIHDPESQFQFLMSWHRYKSLKLLHRDTS